MKRYIQVLVLLLICGCEIFSLREAQKPDNPPKWNNFYTTYDLALQNLKYSYEYEQNLAKYSDLFMPEFRFYFSPQDINDYNISTMWTRDMERDMLYNLHNMAEIDSISMEKIPEQNDDIQSTPVKLYRQYTIKLTRNSEIKTYTGKMELQMVQDNGFWRIIKWYDYRASSSNAQPSWGKLKYEYSV